MEKKRVEKGEKYWYISYFLDVCYGYENSSMFDLLRFEANNYFVDREEAEAMARKLRAVLKGAGVIEIPNEKEINHASILNTHEHDEDILDNDIDLEAERFINGVNLLKSKIVK